MAKAKTLNGQEATKLGVVGRSDQSLKDSANQWCLGLTITPFKLSRKAPEPRRNCCFREVDATFPHAGDRCDGAVLATLLAHKIRPFAPPPPPSAHVRTKPPIDERLP